MDFFDCASAAEHFAKGQNAVPEKLDKTSFSDGV
jgi:hypothetical protein